MPEQRTHLLAVMVLLEYFHRDAVAQIVRLQFGVHSLQMFFPVIGARVLPTTRRPQVDQNNGVSGPKDVPRLAALDLDAP